MHRSRRSSLAGLLNVGDPEDIGAVAQAVYKLFDGVFPISTAAQQPDTRAINEANPLPV
jgi:hypothetical protein